MLCVLVILVITGWPVLDSYLQTEWNAYMHTEYYFGLFLKSNESIFNKNCCISEVCGKPQRTEHYKWIYRVVGREVPTSASNPEITGGVRSTSDHIARSLELQYFRH